MKNVLKIQELERQIRRLKASSGSGPENAMYEQLKENRKIVRDNITNIEHASGVIAKQFEQMMARYEQLNAKSEITSKQKPETAGIASIGILVEDANYLTSELAKLEQKMRELNDKANRLVSEFNVALSESRDMKLKQEQVKKKIDEKQASVIPEITEKEEQIKKLEAVADKVMYEKYKSLRADNIFPVFVPLKDNRCGACQMMQSLSFIQKLKQVGMLPCEECRRIILDI
ncbi:MAG: hypothetical protein ACLRFE_01630 [Clostridia bacterium]